MKVSIIAAYFGSLPSNFRYWLASCGWNPSIDFLIFTDQQVDGAPKNVHIEPMSFEEVGRLASGALSYEVCLKRPYKLCDYKPAYGLIFKRWLNGYDYWGHCDLDMVFGNLEKTFVEYRLHDYQRFLSLGHLSLYKNDSFMNRAFMLDAEGSPGWREAFSSDRSFAFDEVGMREICRGNGISFFEGRPFADISKIYRRFRLALDDVNYDSQAFYVERGGVFRSYESDGVVRSDEFAYIHFKERAFGGDQMRSGSTSCYFIGPEGFLEKAPGVPIPEQIAAVNPFPGKGFERRELRVFERREALERLRRRLGVERRR